MLIKYDPIKGYYEIGDITPILNIFGKGAYKLLETPLENWKIQAEINNIKKILESLELRSKDVDWTKVNKVSALEILQAVAKCDPDVDIELGKIWKKLLEDFFDPEIRNKANITRASNLLRLMDIFTVNCLNILSNTKANEFIAHEILQDFSHKGGYLQIELDKLADLELLCYSAPNGGPFYGNSSKTNYFKWLRCKYGTLDVLIYISHQAKEFLDTIQTN
jgi:hypothetical protein